MHPRTYNKTVTTPKYYAGVGSRSTPRDILLMMRDFGHVLANKGWTLRSGGANGADSVFEEGCDERCGLKEIFLPWKGFNKNDSPFFGPSEDAMKLAAEIHPAFKFIKSRPVRLLHGRNMHEILGQDLHTPVTCVICWTGDGCESIETYGKHTGGTGSAIALASSQNIPVFNLKNGFRYYNVLDFCYG